VTKENATPAELDDETIAFIGRVFAYVRTGDVATMADLLDGGLPPNIRNEKGDSLLMLASYHGHVELSHVLLRHGADPNLRNDRGQTPLAGAAFKGHYTMAQLLLDSGAEVDARDPNNGISGRKARWANGRWPPERRQWRRGHSADADYLD
jgi:ankyrin repeat protein